MMVRHLEIFVIVVDYGKMSQAAEKLYIAQPSVSQAVRELEGCYGARLFEWLSKQLYLADEGWVLLSYAHYIMDSLKNMELTMKNRGSIGRLRIGVGASVGTCLSREKLNCLETKLPGIETEIIVCSTPMIEEMVPESELGMGLVERFVDSRDVVCVPFYENELIIAMGRSRLLYG